MPSTRIAFFLALTALAAKGDIVASFANAGPVDSGTFRTAAVTSNDTITLAYTIDSTGAVSLDASTTNTNSTFVNLVNQFDRPGGTAGSTTNSGFFNTAFSLKIVPVREGSTTPRLSITTNNGGGLALEGQNSNRVDGRTVVPPARETLRFELTAPAGMDLLMKNWSWVDGSGGDMGFSTAEATQDFVNLSASGTRVFDTNTDPEGGALLIGNGGILTFGETPDSTNGSLTVTGSGALTMKSMVIGRQLEKPVRLVIHGSRVSFGQSASSAADDFAVGSAATVETRPDAGGCEPLELGPARLVLDTGSQWILDGTNAAGPYNPGDRFVLANFGSFSGSTGGVGTRNFDLPANRRLDLVHTSTSLYYEVVAQTPASGPNLIIINVDDMAGGQHFNFEGRSSITPTMDSLVSTGLR
jgi:hypothetical protein